MSRKIAEEVLPRLRQRYVGRGREGRSRLIDEVCEATSTSQRLSTEHGICEFFENDGVGKEWPLIRESTALP
jgi:hypothetical protein